MSGYFAVHRGVFEHPMFARDPFSEREAWMWIIGQAAWQPKRVRVGRGVFDLARGQCAFALRFLAEKWQWSVSKVRGFLQRLVNDAMILANPTRDATLITVCNYNEYQPNANAGQHADGTPTARSRHKEEEVNNSNNIHGGDEAPEPTTKALDRESVEITQEIGRICGFTDALDWPWVNPVSRVRTWLSAGWRKTIILESVRAQMARKRDGPPHGINFFEKGIARAHSQVDAPLPEVKIVEAQTVEIRRGTNENLAQTAKRMSGQIVEFGPRPSIYGSAENSNPVRLLPDGTSERP